MQIAAPATGGLWLSLRIKYGRWRYGFIGAGLNPSGFRVSKERFIKWPCKQPELEGHQYAAEHTDIPIPRVCRTYMWHGRLAIEMEYVAGCVTLAAVWWELTSKQRQHVVEQVADYIKALRALKPSSTQGAKVSATSGGACRDVRVATMKTFGPFDDVSAFHRCLTGGVDDASVAKVFGEAVADIHARDYETRFTHGDLGVQNILIRSGKVVSIIDWECSGWYPEYWEYTKAHYNSVYCPDFYEMLRERIPRYDDELAAERALWQSFDQPLNGER
nr:hypothetical protein B0A51_05588 [Rachicladosporium sp. CCFEE 5018]